MGRLLIPELLIANRGDPNWANVVLLNDFNGADASTTFTDLSDSAHTLTAVNNAQLDTAQKKFGTASLLLDGASAVTVGTSQDWNIADGDFTIEAHIRLSSLTGNQAICALYNSPTSTFWWTRITNNGTFVNFGVTSTQWSNAFSFSINTFYHVAWVRSGGTLYMFVDGTMLGTGDAVSFTASWGSIDLTIGAFSFGASDEFNGHIDNLRITKGVARYTANFTPPDREYPDQ